MIGCGPISPSLHDLRVLMEGARAVGGPIGATLELCVLSAALPFEILGIELQNIDWERSRVPVPSRGSSGFRHLALCTSARQCILAVAGSVRGRGQAVTAGRGQPLKETLFRLDRVNRRLGAASPDTLHVGWNFHGIRVTAAKALGSRGVSREQIRKLLYGCESGAGPGNHQCDGTAVAEIWSSVLREAATSKV